MTRVNMADTLNDDGFRGNYLVNPQLAELMAVPYQAYRGKIPFMVLRPLPEVDEQHHELPMFERSEAGQIVPTYWMIRGRGWWKTSGITFFVHDVLSEQGSAYRADEEPAGLICRGVCDCVSSGKAPAVWAKMQKEGELPKKKSLPYIGLMQAIVYQNYDRYAEPHGLFDGDRIPVIAMTDTCSRKIMGGLTQNPKPGSSLTLSSAESPEELLASLVHGDVVGLESPDAKYLAIAPETTNLDQLLHGAQSQTQETVSLQRFGGQRRIETGGETVQMPAHDYRAIPIWDNQSATFDAESAEFLRQQQIKPWRQLILNHSRERQVELLQAVLPWDVMNYCWQDFSGWIPGPDSPAYKKFHGSTSVAQGGHGIPTTGVGAPATSGSSFRSPAPDPMLTNAPMTTMSAATAAIQGMPRGPETGGAQSAGQRRARNPRA